MTENAPARSNQPRHHRTALSLDRRHFILSGSASLLTLLAGCGGTSGSGGTETSTSVPQIAAIPYEASNGEDNVDSVRDLTIWNNTDGEHRVRVTISDPEANVLFYRRDHTIEPGAEPRFEDLMAKKATYRIEFEWDIGLQRAYDWPVDGDHWNAQGILGGSEGEYTMNFRVEPL